MVDLAKAYLEVRDRLVDLVTSLDDPALATPVPSCPGWSVQDVLAHHVGLAVDVTTGAAPEFVEVPLDLLEQATNPMIARSRDAMTARQVNERRGTRARALIQEWQQATPSLCELLRRARRFQFPFVPMMRFAMVIDVAVHEDDIRSALGHDPAPAGDAHALAIAGNGTALSARMQRLGLPALVISIDGEQRTYGEGAPAITVRVNQPDAFRMLSGRYPPEKLVTLDWSADPGPYLRVIAEPYGPPLDAA